MNGDAPGTALSIDIDEGAGDMPVDRPTLDPSVVDEDGDVAGGLPVRAIRNGNGTVTLPLRFPVPISIRSASGEVRAEKYEQLTFHRLNGADMRAVQATSKETAPVVMFARSTRTKMPIMSVLYDKMDGADIADASTIVESFFGSGRTTGRSS